jgi:predicted nucleotidyltransferase
MEQTDIIQILRQFKDENHQKYSILSIGVFGSAGRGTLKDQNDIDGVVELGNPDLFNLIGIKQELEESFRCSVDVVRCGDNMNGFLKSRIEQEAVYA